MRRSIATPCPVVDHQKDYIDDTCFGDTTSNIEFTTTFQASFRNVRPRRGQVSRRPTSNFVIHEDAEEYSGGAFRGTKEGAGAEPVSSLSRPARRVPTRVNVPHGLSDSHNSVQTTSQARETRTAKPRAPSSTAKPHAAPSLLSHQSPQAEMASRAEIEEQKIGVAKRPARRKTLYIPSDDTTQPTMWMGIFSPVKNQIEGQDKESHFQTQDITGIAARMLEKRKGRSSTVQPRPKRIPLGANATAQGTAGAVIDRPGALTGKENLPPNLCLPDNSIRKAPPKNEVSLATEKDRQRRKFLTQARLDNLSKPKRLSHGNATDVSTMYEVGKVKDAVESPTHNKVPWNAGPKYVAPSEESRNKTPSPKSATSTRPRQSYPVQTNVPTRVVPLVLPRSFDATSRMPIVEHIQNPEMYEEDWLGHQELAITQLLNSHFSQMQPDCRLDQDQLRAQLLDKYNSPEMNMLYTRVQAAILYGSLSLSHEAMLQMQSLVKDVGRKQKFIRFWLDNYNNALLHVALEVVTGKQVHSQAKKIPSQSNASNPSERFLLTRFIEAFLLRHEEAHFKTPGTGSSNNDLGSRTILKCLMLIKALDMLKTDEIMVVNAPLFRGNASFKSSSSAVQILAQMLNPAVGDALRALRQQGYQVCHEQTPLEEVVFRIDNLAVDLRDGILLTRLVENLLYKPASIHPECVNACETKTIYMPEGDTISFTSQETSPLSQHLKIPCISRATKLWNIQLALGALAGIKDINLMIEDTTAEDIVDGYREKTVKLLWALVARSGLPEFVDHTDLCQEIRRLDPTRTTGFSHFDYEPGSQKDCEHLLKEWTKAVAASKGLVVRNFTTSFSDGKVFEAILDEYEPYLANTTHKGLSLNTRLLRLGCSRQFSDLFSARQERVHIFGKDFVLAALIFLSSRVVGPSKLCRKAITIQRYWRTHWQAVQVRRQAIKRGLAEACAASVSFKQWTTNNVTDSDPCDVMPAGPWKTEIYEDIWLSL